MSGGGSNRSRDLGLRAGGMLLLAIGSWAMRALFGPGLHGHAITAVRCGLAAAGFLSLSLGTALFALGAHLFDRIELSERWRRRSAFDARSRSAPVDPCGH